MLGQQLAVLARAQRKSQKYLAQVAGISPVTLNRFLNGKASLGSEVLVALMSELGVDLSEIVESRIEQCAFGKSNVISLPLRNLIGEVKELSTDKQATLTKYINWFIEQNRKKRPS